MDAQSPIDVSSPGLSPRFATIKAWTVLSGMSRRNVFDHIAKGNLVAHKLGKRTLVDVEAGLAWIKSQPAPKIRLTAPRPKKGGRPGRKPRRAAGGIDATPP
jgi:hypothetical protein